MVEQDKHGHEHVYAVRPCPAPKTGGQQTRCSFPKAEHFTCAAVGRHVVPQPATQPLHNDPCVRCCYGSHLSSEAVHLIPELLLHVQAPDPTYVIRLLLAGGHSAQQLHHLVDQVAAHPPGPALPPFPTLPGSQASLPNGTSAAEPLRVSLPLGSSQQATPGPQPRSDAALKVGHLCLHALQGIGCPVQPAQLRPSVHPLRDLALSPCVGRDLPRVLQR